MKQIIIKYCFVVLAIFATSITTNAQKSKYKCLVQLNTYNGLGAYIVVSLIDAKGNYEKTLYVLGKDKKWYNGWKEWDKAQKNKKENLDGITGASVASGDRAVVVLEIDDAKINAGYKLRFESAVEERQYYSKDAEVALTTEGLATPKINGTGYVKFVRLSKQ